MRIASFAQITVILWSLAGCSLKNTATATILVIFGNPPTVSTNEYFVDTQTEVLKSDGFLRQVGTALKLSGKWNLSQNEIVTKLDRAISIRAGKEPGQIVIVASGLDRQTAADVVNELCNCYVSRKLWDSENGGPRRKVNVTIVQRAE